MMDRELYLVRTIPRISREGLQYLLTVSRVLYNWETPWRE
jgi:hypothetical protein